MTILGRTALAIALIAAVNCGGGKGGSTPTPTNPTPTLSAAGVAPSLAAEINTTFKAALRAGVAAASAKSTSPRDVLARLLEELLGVPLSAQGGFVANC